MVHAMLLSFMMGVGGCATCPRPRVPCAGPDAPASPSRQAAPSTANPPEPPSEAEASETKAAEKPLSVDEWMDVHRERIERDRVERYGDRGVTLAHYAAEAGRLDVLEKLASQGVDIHATAVDGRTPFFWAAGGGHLDAMHWIDETAEPTPRRDASSPQKGYRVLREALVSTRPRRGGHVAVMAWLHERGADIHAKAKDGKTALFWAALGGNTEAMAWLTERGAEVDAPDDNIRIRPLHMAALGGHVEAMAWLTKRGAALDVEDAVRRDPMRWAMLGAHLPAMRWLHARGVGAQAFQDELAQTTFDLAMLEGRLDTLQWLYERGVRFSDEFPTIDDYLRSAAAYGQVAVMEWLKELGADPLHRARNGSTAFLIAAKAGHVEAMKWLKEQGADIAAAGTQGWWRTPLAQTVWEQKFEAAKWLLEQGADLNALNKNGQTMLSEAVNQKRYETVRWLIEHGADVTSAPRTDDMLFSLPALPKARMADAATPDHLLRSPPTWGAVNTGAGHNAASTRIVTDVVNGMGLRALIAQGGAADGRGLFAIQSSRANGFDFNGHAAIVIDRVYVPAEAKDGVSLSLAMQTGPRFEWFETEPRHLKPGWNEQPLRFDLRAKNWKSQAGGWRYAEAPRNLDQTRRISLLLFNGARALTVYAAGMAFEVDE